MNLRQKSFIFEYIIVLWFAIQLLPFYNVSILPTALTFLILIGTKYHYELFRFNYFMFFFVQAFLLWTSSFKMKIGALILSVFIVTMFPVYEYPEPTGKYKVGYKSLNPNRALDMAIFYPTLEQDFSRNQAFDSQAKVSERNFYGFKLIVCRFVPLPLPKFLVDLAHSFYKNVYMNVTKDAQIIANTDNGKFPVILFSHGLGSFKHLYSIYLREWASHGFIVISVDHDEEVILKWKKYVDFVNVRKPQLEVRASTIGKILDFIHEETKMRSLFGSQVEVDHDKVFLAGHSFGSATSATVILNDNRVTGGLVLFDPWLDPCSESIYTKSAEKPILILRSSGFDRIKPIKNNITKFLEANKNHIFSGYYKNTTHNDVTDFILTKPKGILNTLLMLGRFEKSSRESKLLLHYSLVNIFLETVCNEKNKGKSNSELVENVRERLQNFLKTQNKVKEFHFDV